MNRSARKRLAVQTVNEPIDWHDTKAVKEMCEKLIRYHNPTGLLKLKQDFVDEAPLSDYQLSTMMQKAFDSNQWRKELRPTYLELIKGKPYCLKLGASYPEVDNFVGFFQTFYTYRYRGQINKSLKKPTSCNYDPLQFRRPISRNTRSVGAVHRSLTTCRETSRQLNRTSKSRQAKTPKRPRTNRTSDTVIQTRPMICQRSRSSNSPFFTDGMLAQASDFLNSEIPPIEQGVQKRRLAQHCSELIRDCTTELKKKYISKKVPPTEFFRLPTDETVM